MKQKTEIWGVYRDTRTDSIGRRQNNGHLWEVSTEGIIKIDGEIQTPTIKNRYLVVRNHFVHRAVAIVHIPNPEHKPEVDHINGNPLDNRVENLRWVTSSENKLNPITRKNNSDSHKGKSAWNKGKKTGFHWYNNGIDSILCKEQPEGFVKGRLLNK